eukprot:GHVU01003850.1.p2 GENE.GHVU01003850.1~~GHVU01003850.1.p2  ORF type:complete len:137 (-),score=22.09 GHVU01003850.1:712-1122(-)
MGIYADVDAHIEVNSVDISSWITSSNVNIQADTVDTVAMGDTWVTTKPTFKRGSVSLEINQDFAASAIDATLNGLVGTSVAFKYRPVSGSVVGATNPEYTGNVVITEYSPADQGAGDIASFSVTWPFDGAVTRAAA